MSNIPLHVLYYAKGVEPRLGVTGETAWNILKFDLPRVIILAGGDLRGFKPQDFIPEQMFKNLDAIKYSTVELKDEKIVPNPLLRISVPFAYDSAMTIEENDAKGEGISLFEKMSEEFRKLLEAIKHLIFFLNQKVEELDQDLKSILKAAYHPNSRKPWWIRDNLWGIQRFGQFLVDKKIKLNKALVSSVKAVRTASEKKGRHFYTA